VRGLEVVQGGRGRREEAINWRGETQQKKPEDRQNR
jgi:hypothetical protein